MRAKRVDREWTDDEVEDLKHCAAEGLSFRKAAERLNRTRNSIAGKANRIGITFSGGSWSWR